MACAAAFCLASYWLSGVRLEERLSYSGKAYTGREGLDEASVLPLTALPGSVMPVVFASYFIAVPSALSAGLSDPPAFMAVFDMQAWFDPDRPWATAGLAVYCLLVLVFGRLSQAMSVNAAELADSLRRAGCSIEGVPSGQETEAYLGRRIRVMTDAGSVGLCIAASLPAAAAALLGVAGLGYAGTSVLVMISVSRECAAEAYAMLRSEGWKRCMPKMAKGPRSGDPFALLEKARESA